MKSIEHSITASPAQLKKLLSGGAITLKPGQIGDGPHLLSVMPNTARRIQTAMRKGKGVRVSLKKGETIGGNAATDFFNKAGNTLKNTFTPSLGKDIARAAIDVGTSTVLPAAGAALGSVAGNPFLGEVAGAAAGSALNQYAATKGYGLKSKKSGYGNPMISSNAVVLRKYGSQKEQKGKGVFKTLNKIGISKKQVITAAKDVGKAAVRVGAKVAGEAISAYTGNPVAGAAFEKIAVAGADKLIDSGSVKKGLEQAGSSASGVAKDIAIEAVDDYVDKNMTGPEKKIAQKALAKKYPSAKDLIYDYADTRYNIAKSRSPQFVGKYIDPIVDAISDSTNTSKLGVPAFQEAAYYGYGMKKGGKLPMRVMSMKGCGFTAGNRSIMVAEPPSSVIQTGGPYQKVNSAAMSPFIASSPQLANIPIRGGACCMGGSFLPAGTKGGSFLPSG
jgi:hypothetical protein